MSANSEPSAKVLFRVPKDDGSAEVETLWASPLGEDLYRLENLPFFAYGVSFQDIVYAPLSEVEGFPTFERVHSSSGNKTVRIILAAAAQPGNASRRLLDGLVALGCEYEGANRTYIAVNIPPAVKLSTVGDYLMAHDAEWEYANPTHEQVESGGIDDA